MSKIMYANYAGIKNEHHIPDAVAMSDLKNGYLVVKGINDKGQHIATLPSNTDECMKELWFVHNTITQPELDSDADFTIKEGSFARIWRFKPDYPVYVSKDLIDGEVSVGAYLVPDDMNYGKLKVTADATGYYIAMRVTEVLASAQSVIYLCEVMVNN